MTASRSHANAVGTIVLDRKELDLLRQADRGAVIHSGTRALRRYAGHNYDVTLQIASLLRDGYLTITATGVYRPTQAGADQVGLDDRAALDADLKRRRALVMAARPRGGRR